MSTPLISIQKLSKTFVKVKREALCELSAEIHKEQVFGLVGPDGAGKTTLLRLVAGLLIPTSGLIHIDPKYSIGYMPQRFGLYEDLTVLQNLQLYADLKGVDPKKLTEKIEELLHFTALAPFKDRLSGNLSGGMKQKLGLACVLIKRPDLLLLDEPTVGLDPVARRELWQMIQRLVKDKVTVLWSTASLDEAQECSSVLLLNRGHLLYQGPPQAFSGRVAGRVFETSDVKEPRKELMHLFSQSAILDGVIHKEQLRLVLRHDSPSLKFAKKAIEPRFEDAFIDVLGGWRPQTSITSIMKPIIEKNGEAMIQADHLCKKFGSFTAVRDTSFSIHRGEIFGLLGPNGSGKSTIFKMLCGLIHPTSGSIHIDGVNLAKEPSKARGKIGYMAQKLSLYSDLTVAQNMSFFAGIYGLKGPVLKKMTAHMVAVFQLESYLNSCVSDLPLGISQRLALACCTMHTPSILFLDEPTSGVDPVTRREFWYHIYALVQLGTTVLVSTHFLDEAEYCDRIAFIYYGDLMLVDTPQRAKAHFISPSNPEPTLQDVFITMIEEKQRAQ